ncbi:MAG TPA: hypothetical protein V6D14_04340 [Coleofasciculaceae cyanobacterium]|jgi:two-component system chemotaxis response regulator CheB
MPNQELKPDSVELDKNPLEGSNPAGTLSGLVCPECGGVIWEMRKGTLRRLECHVGHAFSVESFLEEQSEEIERLLWAAMRTLKDRVKIIRRMADEARNKNEPVAAQQFEEEAQQVLKRAELIRQALLERNTEDFP